MIQQNKPEDMSHRINNAYSLFSEIEELFEDVSRRSYLTSNLSKDEFDSLIEELLVCFTLSNDKSKILIVNIWKSIVNESIH